VSGGDAKPLERRSGPRQHRPEAIFHCAALSSRCGWLRLWLAGVALRAGGSSRPAPQWPIGGRALFVVSEAWLVVGKEDLGNKITSGAHFGLGEDVTQVRLHRVYRDHETVSDLRRR
jgi:hypothetical protein